jgi:fatty acid desaturase
MSIDNAGAKACSAEGERRGSEFAELSRQARDAGHFRRRDGYYLRRAAAVLGLTATGWTALILLGPTWWHLLTAVFLGVMFTQLGFLGHDVGHRQVFRTRRGAYVCGLLLANVGIGLSYGWWLDKHNRHHAHPNDLERDPDVAPGALVFDAEHTARRTGIGRRLTSVQAYLFFPMLLLEGLNLHLASARALRSGTLPARWLEGSLLALHATAYVTVVALVLPWPQALVFVAVQQATFGLYMGLSFAPNHKGMPMERPEDNWDYLRRQVITSRNVTGGPVVDPRWAELPDRAPPLPEHAEPGPKPRAAAGPRLLRRARHPLHRVRRPRVLPAVPGAPGHGRPRTVKVSQNGVLRYCRFAYAGVR